MQKRQTLSVQTRRDKQTIFKDFIRPSPADTISSSTTIGTGFSGGTSANPCSGQTPGATRVPCGEYQTDLDGVIATAGWGGQGQQPFQVHEGENFSGSGGYDPTGVYANGNGGILETIAHPGIGTAWFGARVYSRVLWEDVGEPISVLFKFSFLLLGENADSVTQHALNFGIRAADYRSGTARIAGSPPFQGDTDIHHYDFTWSPYGIRVVWNEAPIRALGDSYLANAAGISQPIDPIEAGPIYNLLLTSTSFGDLSMKFWKSGDDVAVFRSISFPVVYTGEGGTGNDTPPNISINNVPNFQPHMTVDDAMHSIVAVHAVIVNPVDSGEPLAPIPDCSMPPQGPGLFVDRLFRKYNWWQPQYTGLQYYGRVWFNGVLVVQGVDYTIQDTYKIIPTTVLPADALVEAETIY